MKCSETTKWIRKTLLLICLLIVGATYALATATTEKVDNNGTIITVSAAGDIAAMTDLSSVNEAIKVVSAEGTTVKLSAEDINALMTLTGHCTLDLREVDASTLAETTSTNSDYQAVILSTSMAESVSTIKEKFTKSDAVVVAIDSKAFLLGENWSHSASYFMLSDDETIVTVYVANSGDIDHLASAQTNVGSKATTVVIYGTVNEDDISNILTKISTSATTIDLSKAIFDKSKKITLPSVATLILPNTEDFSDYESSSINRTIVYNLDSNDSSQAKFSIVTDWPRSGSADMTMDFGDEGIEIEELPSGVKNAITDASLSGSLTITGKLTAKTLQAIISATTTTTESGSSSKITSVDLTDATLGEGAVDILAEYLKDNTTLTSITLPKNLSLEDKKKIAAAASEDLAKTMSDIDVTQDTDSDGNAIEGAYTITINMGPLGYVNGNNYIINLTDEQKTALKGATSITVQGTDGSVYKMSNDEMSVFIYHLSQTLGTLGSYNNKVSTVETLNLSKVEMSEEITFNSSNVISCNQSGSELNSVKTFYSPLLAETKDKDGNTIRAIPDGNVGWHTNFSSSLFGLSSKSKLETLYIAEGTTDIGNYAFYSQTSLTSVTFPSTLTRIGAHAFEQCTTLDDITFNSGLERIEDSAFTQSLTKTQLLEFPSSVVYIGANAFDYARQLMDVYFFGEYENGELYVDYTAFAATSTYGDHGFTPQAYGKYPKIGSRQNFIANAGWLCMLHLNPNMSDEMKAKYSDQIAAKTYSTPDEYVGEQYMWPNSYNTTTYTIGEFKQVADMHDNTNMKLIDGTAMDKNGAGLQKFILVSFDATEEEDKEWTWNLSADKWWTIMVPFNMTIEQVRTTFGANTQVCKFSKAVRYKETDSTTGNVSGLLSLQFTDEQCYGKTETSEIAIHAYVAYMIYPSGEVDKDNFCVFKGYKLYTPAARIATTLSAVDKDGKELSDYKYTFIGNQFINTDNAKSINAVSMPLYYYFLGDDGAKHRLYINNSEDSRWNQWTAVVIPEFGSPYGVNDWTQFFGGKTTPAKLNSAFGNDGETTQVERVVVEAGSHYADSVYNLNGQRVGKYGSMDTLPKGFYIVNGKKIVKK